MAVAILAETRIQRTGRAVPHVTVGFVTQIAIAAGVTGQASANVRASGVGAGGIHRTRIASALVDVRAADAVTLITRVTTASERTHGITTRSVITAVVRSGAALVHIGTSHAVTSVASVATASERTHRVSAGRVITAVVRASDALVDVRAVDAVAGETHVAGAGETADRIATGRVITAVVRAQRALVVVRARDAVTGESHVAGAGETADRIATGRVVTAVVRASDALVHIGTSDAVAGKPRVAGAVESAERVRTRGVITAVIRASAALVDVRARDAVAGETRVAGASETTKSIATRGIHIAIVGTQRTFIIIGTSHTVTGVARVAGAGEASHGVSAGGVHVAVIRAGHALIHIGTSDAVAGESRIAGASERTHNISTHGIRITVVGSGHALIHVRAAKAADREASVASAGSVAGVEIHQTLTMTAAGLSGARIQHASAGNQLNIPCFTALAVSASVAGRAGTFRHAPTVDDTSAVVQARVGIASVGEASPTNVHKSIVAGVAAETDVTDLAMALVRTGDVQAIGMTKARVGQALVDVRAHKTGPLVAVVAGADERAVRVTTGGVGVARVSNALVDIRAHKAGPLVAVVAFADERAIGITTGGVSVARIGQTLVHIRAAQAISLVAFKAITGSFRVSSVQLTNAVPRTMLFQAGVEHAGHIVQTRIALFAGLTELTGIPFFGTIAGEVLTVSNTLAREAGVGIAGIHNLLRDAGAFQRTDESVVTGLASIASIAFGTVTNEFYFVHRFAFALIQTGLLKAGVVGHGNAIVIIDVALVSRTALVAKRAGVTGITNAQSAIAFRRANAVNALTIAPQGALLDGVVIASPDTEKNNNKHQKTEFRHDVLLSPNGETPFEGKNIAVYLFLNCD